MVSMMQAEEKLADENVIVRAVIKVLAGMDPMVASGPCDDRSCFFCQHDEYDKEPHAENCIWLQTKQLKYY